MMRGAMNPSYANDEFKHDDVTQDNESESAVKKGRPRSQKSHKAIIRAVNALLLHMSVQDMSIEAIAKKAKVGKTTIYRWWPNKTALVMDALVNQPAMQTSMGTPKNNIEAVLMQLDKLIRLLNSKNGETIAQLFSEAQASPESQKIFEENFLSPLIDAIQFSFEEGQRNGEFTRLVPSKTAVDMLCGPIFFRLMAHPRDLDDSFQVNYPHDIVNLLKA